MKVRAGFVSNSSSSSFLLAVKAGHRLTTEEVVKEMKVAEDSPLYPFACNIASFIASQQEEGTMSTRELLDDFGVDEIDELPEEYQAPLKNGFEITRFYASDEDYYGTAETWLCQNGLTIEGENFMVDGEGGY